jgi:TonB family protein
MAKHPIRAIPIAVLAFCSVPAAAQDLQSEQAPDQRPTVITRPDWERRPTAADLSSAYPAEAMRVGAGGSARLSCTVETNGFLNNCQVAEEDPQGLGFGAAALSLAPKFKMSPQSVDGVPLGGARVEIPIGFNCGGCRPRNVTGLTQRTFFNVLWTSTPSLDQWMSAYPERARQYPVDANVSLQCTFGDEGELASCFVRTEEPSGRGFGPAARRLASFFRGPELDQNEESTRGGIVILNIHFPAAFASGEPPAPGVPKLLSGPTPESVAAAFPEAARNQGVEYGRTVLSCRRTAVGRLERCAALDEFPADMGFGDAAISLTPQFLISTWTDDGRLAAEEIAIPIEFGDPADDPYSREGVTAMIMELIEQGRRADASTALTAYINAVRPEPAASPYPLLRTLAFSYDLDGDDQKALDVWRIVVEAMPENADAFNELCWLKASQLSLASAIEDCEVAVGLEPGSAKYLDSLAFARLKFGDPRAALATYDAAIEIRPESAYSLYGRGVAKARLGDDRGARGDMRAAQRLRSNIDQEFAAYGVRP